MDFQSFKFWKQQKNPTEIIEENLGDLSFLGNSVAFKKYLEIIEWRIHNYAERSLFNPTKDKTYDQGYADGMRTVLVDFKRITEAYKKRTKELKEK